MTFLNHLILGLAMAAQLLLGLGRGVVLCVESDGTVNFEVSSISCCEPEAVHAGDEDENRDECTSEQDDCGDCTDQSFQLLGTPKGEHVLPPLVAVPVGLVAAPPVHDAVCGARALEPPTVEQRLARLRAVVLRC